MAIENAFLEYKIQDFFLVFEKSYATPNHWDEPLRIFANKVFEGIRKGVEEEVWKRRRLTEAG